MCDYDKQGTKKCSRTRIKAPWTLDQFESVQNVGKALIYMKLNELPRTGFRSDPT